MRVFGPRAGFSTVLILGAMILLVAILIGNRMGNNVLGQLSSRLPQIAPTALLPTAQPTFLGKSEQNWKKTQIMAVATDPGFPDPRITPEPPPPETPRPVYKERSPSSSHHETPDAEPSDTIDVTLPTAGPSISPTFSYTSPPLPMPIVTHAPVETSEPSDIEATHGPSGRATTRPYPTLPPIPVQTLNP